MEQAISPFQSYVTDAAQRFDIYAHILHKALRLFMNETLHAVGAIDGTDDREVAGVVE